MNHNLQKKLQLKEFNDVKYIPILVEESSFKENIDFMDTLGLKNTKNIVFVSVELNELTAPAFKNFMPLFQKMRDKFKEKFRLVVIGDKPTKYFKNFELEIDFISRSSIVHQFKSIVKSSADFHLVLNKKNMFSTNSETLFQFAERGLFGIPIATMDQSPLNEIIQDKQTGFLFKKKEDFCTLVEELMKDKKNLLEMSETLKNVVVTNCQLTDDQINILGSLLFDNYDVILTDDEDEHS